MTSTLDEANEKKTPRMMNKMNKNQRQTPFQG